MIDRDKARQILCQLETMGKNPPSRQWAYDLQNRWDAGDRAHIAPAALAMAREAYKIDQEGLINEEN